MNKRVWMALLLGSMGFAQSAEAKVIFSCKTENNKYI